ncbi:MAG: PAS domain S-box protein [Firmicutes bacterium]|nr:PAS domain S-box protein [Bacillota bacterium]
MNSGVQLLLDSFWRNSMDIHGIMNSRGEIYFNPAFARITGYMTDKAKFMDLFWKVHRNERKKIIEARKKIQQGETTYFVDVRFRCQNGQYKWLSWNATYDRETNALLITGRDITNKKTMSVVFETIFQYSPNIKIILREHDRRVLAVNKTFEKILQYKADEVVGKTLEEIKIKTIPNNEQTWLTVYHQGFSAKHISLQCKDNVVRDLIYTSVPIRYQGECSILIVAVDITEQNKLAKELNRLEKLHIIGQMAGGICHEMRNLITVIRGYLQLMLKNNNIQQVKQNIEFMISELERANSIITDFLAIAKRDSEYTNFQVTNLNKVIDRLYPLLKADAVQQNKKIFLELADETFIYAKESELRQLILNLVRNALDASSPGQKVIISTTKSEHQVKLIVEDFGPGIDPHILKNLGTPFLTTKKEGTGLGLAICYAIAERHQANIDVSTSNQGTVFTVIFPAMKVNQLTAAAKT